MSGPVALVGGGEFPTSLADFDLGLLSASGRRRPRVVILPTGAAPAGDEAFERVAAAGLERFRSLGAEVETVDVRDREAAADDGHAQAIGEADLIYLCDGPAAYLRETLCDTPVWAAVCDANDRGAILLGSGGGAVVLGDRQFEAGLRLGLPVRWVDGLCAAPGLVVLPRYDARPEPVMALVAMTAPRDMPVIGIDSETAVIGRNGSWEVHGRARVTVWRGRRRERHRCGEAFRLDPTERSGVG